MPRRKTSEDYHMLAKKRGFRWLGPEVRNSKMKSGWECNNGHQWQAIYNVIQQGFGCPLCSGNKRKEPEDYEALAELRGFKWLGPTVTNALTKSNWECSRGRHQWQTTYHHVREGHGCPICSREQRNAMFRKKPADYHQMAASRGFRWLGPEVSGARVKTGWQCPQGHQWQARYNNIQQGSGCPECARLKRTKQKK